METLIVALLGIAGFVAVVFAFGTASEKLRERTGKDIGDWFGTLVAICFALGIGYGGLYLVRWGMSDESVVLVVIGIFIMCIVGMLIWGAWSDNSGSGYNPMSGKRAHYNKHGNLTGYSDKE